MGFDDLFNDGQSKSGPRFLFLARDPKKLFEDPGEILSRIPLSRISDGKRTTFSSAWAEKVLAAGRGVSEGIGKKILKT